MCIGVCIVHANDYPTSLAGSAVLGWRLGGSASPLNVFHRWSRNIVCFIPVMACWGFARWRDALVHTNNHTLMVMVINHLCHNPRAQESRMD